VGVRDGKSWRKLHANWTTQLAPMRMS
jgi:hypothetical protein